MYEQQILNAWTSEMLRHQDRCAYLCSWLLSNQDNPGKWPDIMVKIKKEFELHHENARRNDDLALIGVCLE